MTMVVITANIDGDTGAFESDVRDLLLKHRCEINFKQNISGLIYFASTSAQPTSNIEPDIPLDSNVSTELTPTSIPALPPQEIEVTLATAPEEVPAELPPEPTNITAVEVPPITANNDPVLPFKDVVLKNLSVACTIPSFINKNTSTSFLHASNVSKTNEFVSFTYCNMSYQFPIQRNVEYPFMINPVCNINPFYTDTTIRVVVEINSSETFYPCLLCVIDKEDNQERVIFGLDMIDIVCPVK